MLSLTLLLALHLPSVVPNVPNRQPQFAAANGMVAMVFGSGGSVWFARSTDAGRTFSKPLEVGEFPKLALGRHRGPRVAIAGKTILVSAIESQGDLYCWRSTDGGRTWSKPARVNDKAGATREGLDALAADAEGHAAVAWLDDRIPGGKRLWGAFSNDAGATWSKNVLLYESPSGTICQCCHPSLLALGGGEFAAMWRNVIAGSRDFYVMRIRGGRPAGPAVKQGQGTWKLDACPMDGGGIAASGGEIVTAWRREHDVYLSRPGQPEVRLGPGQDVAVAANRRGPYAVWSSAGAIEGMPPGASAPVHLADHGAFPSIVALPDGAMLAAWEENGAIATRRIE
jgi:BNR/Asp-box repeat